MTVAIFALSAIEALAGLASLRLSLRVPLPPAAGEYGWVLGFIITFAIFTLLLLGLLRFLRSRLPFELIFGLALIGGLVALSSAWLRPDLALGLAAALTILRFAVPRVAVQNAVFLLGLAGVALALGVAVRPEPLAILLGVLAVYDVISVYATRHMVALASGLASRGVVVALVIPHTFIGWLQKTAALKPGEHARLLGGGDLALPAAFVVAALQSDARAALFSAFGSLLGLAASLYLFSHQRAHRPMPALPPIVAGTVLGYFIAL